jgi:hypothetical protein
MLSTRNESENNYLPFTICHFLTWKSDPHWKRKEMEPYAMENDKWKMINGKFGSGSIRLNY